MDEEIEGEVDLCGPIVKETSSVAESPRAHSITNNHAERIPSGCAIARRGTTKVQISLIPLGRPNHLQ